MPTSARKSSIGGPRRGVQKYIPYHADDLLRGKRTGIAVGYVDRNSDEFEPFDQVMQQADLRTPPKPKVRNKKRRAPKTPVIEEDDGDGEMSMELEDSLPNSPTAYFSNRQSSITSSVQRVGSSSRPVARLSDVDFDKIPSPRPLSSARRKSAMKGRSSGLSRPSATLLDEDENGMEDDGFDDSYDIPRPPSDYASDDPHTPVARHAKRHLSAGRPSFAPVHLDFDDEGFDQEKEDGNGVEDEISQGLEQVELQMDVDDPDEPQYEDQGQDEEGLEPIEEEPEPMDYEPDNFNAQQEEEHEPEPELEPEPEHEPEPEPSGKVKGKGKGKGRSRAENDSMEDQRPSKRTKKSAEAEGETQKKPKKKVQKENVLQEAVHDQNVDDDSGLRRSRRMKYKPLEWWRLEKVVYGRRDSGQCFVPSIKEIHRLPKEDVQPLGAKHRRKKRTRSQSATVEPEVDLHYNPEEGWDEATESDGIVIDYETREEVMKRIAFTAKMVHTKQAANADFAFQKIFGDSDFMAAGQLLIPPKGMKPTKGTKDNTFIFYLIEGAVTFRVHRTSYVLTTGSMFMVPRGNQYHIRNISDRDAKLFFAQARKLPDEPDESEGSRTPSQSRSPSRQRAAN